MVQNSKNTYQLTQSTIEKLGYYVYLLIDPRNNEPFYVGKGHGNRINEHLLGALETELDEVKKIKRIHEILGNDLEVSQVIVRHGMSDSEAFEVECSLIDYIGINNLTNLVSGHYSADRGLMSLQEIEIKYQAEDAEFAEPALLININRLYHHDINETELYEITRKHWNVSQARVAKIRVVCAVYVGIIREVYIPTAWHESPPKFQGRSYFTGNVAPVVLRDKYIYKSVSKYWKRGSQNPIKYVSP